MFSSLSKGIGCLAQNWPFLPTKLPFLGKSRPCWLIWCPVDWLLFYSDAGLVIFEFREALKKSWYFLGIFLVSGIPKLYVKFGWPLFLALKTRLFWPIVTFLFLNVPRRGGGSTGLGNIPKKIYQCFSKQDLWFNIQVYCGVPSCSWGKSKRLRLRGCLPEKCTSSVFVNKTTNVQLCSSQRESYLGGVGGGVRGLKQLVKTKKSYSCETNDKRTNQ